MHKVLVPMANHAPHPATRAPMHLARATYINQLVQRDLMPVFVSGLMTPAMVAEAYRECAALLFMGGGDFDARLYGQANHRETQCNEPQRDVLEMALARMALHDHKPFLGVCRGAQALAIASGGTLYQHVPDMGLHEEHGIGEGNGYDHLLIRPGHEVMLQKGTAMERLLGPSVIMNTGHHQSVASVGPELIISGITPGGIAEFIEHTDRGYFCLGVQGHPEVGGPVADRIFDAFAHAVLK